MTESPKPKYREILDRLAADIHSGRYKPGQRFPSEAALVKRFGASRITVGRSVRELQQQGLVDRVAGSGTFVRSSPERENLLFGLIIPDLGETEIFEPMCQGIARAAGSPGHALLWPHSGATARSRAQQALELSRQCISRRVAGVFFAPLEFDREAAETNRRILQALKKAGIPVVLLDRRPDEPSPGGRSDLVGIDNHRAGFLATEHLIRSGARRIVFVCFAHHASTVRTRIAGYQDALAANRRKLGGELVIEESTPLPWTSGRYDGIVCANDKVAGRIMHSLLQRGERIPHNVRIVGIDDVAYARLLPVPLTTVHQPYRDIGEAALHVMIERLDRPKAPTRNVLLDCWVVVRESCGAAS